MKVSKRAAEWTKFSTRPWIPQYFVSLFSRCFDSKRFGSRDQEIKRSRDQEIKRSRDQEKEDTNPELDSADLVAAHHWLVCFLGRSRSVNDTKKRRTKKKEEEKKGRQTFHPDLRAPRPVLEETKIVGSSSALYLA